MTAPTPPGTKRKRPFEHAITLNVDAATVWQAIASGEGLKRWFPIDARVTPPSQGKPGTIFLSWGPTCEGEGPISLWEPSKALGWTEDHGPVKISVDFTIEPANPSAPDEATVLRVVHSGFGEGAQWDDMFDSISNGWKFEFLSLKHALERHPGADRSMFYEPVPCSLSTDDAWSRLAANGALVRGTSLSTLREGTEFTFTAPTAERLTGRILRVIPGRSVVCIVRELNDALLRIEIERRQEGCTPFVSLAIWGPARSDLETLRKPWRDALERALDTRSSPQNS